MALSTLRGRDLGFLSSSTPSITLKGFVAPRTRVSAPVLSKKMPRIQCFAVPNLVPLLKDQAITVKDFALANSQRAAPYVPHMLCFVFGYVMGSWVTKAVRDGKFGDKGILSSLIKGSEKEKGEILVKMLTAYQESLETGDLKNFLLAAACLVEVVLLLGKHVKTTPPPSTNGGSGGAEMKN